MNGKKELDLLQRLRPLHLMTILVLYALGVGFAHYLGVQINSGLLLTGVLWVIFLSTGFYFLGDHFDTPFEGGLNDVQSDTKPIQGNQPDHNKDLLLYVSVSCLAAAAVFTVLLGVQGGLNLPSGILMSCFFGAFCLLVVPGISLDNSGIGEFITSIILVVIPPALAFYLQYGAFHRILYLAIFPIFPLHLAMILILRLKSYPADVQKNQKTLLVRVGWVRGIFIHNLLILSGFLLFGVSLLFAMPVRIVGPVFFALPAAAYLIWYLSHLENGAPVRWPLILLLSLVVFFLPVYLITFSTWIR